MPGRNHLITALVPLAASLLAACGGAPADKAAPAPEVEFANPDFILSADEVAELIETATVAENFDLVLLDARSSGDYAAGHLPGAASLPPSTLDRESGDFSFQVRPADEIAPVLEAAGINQDSQVVIYDSGGSFNAARVWWVLDYYGHPEKAVLDGGFAVWQSADGAVETGEVTRGSGDFTPVPDASKIADYDYVLEHIGTDATSICDARRAADHQEAAIPGAVSLPYTETFVGSSPLVKDAASLQQTFEEVGLSPDEEIIFYCIGGYLSSQDYLLARSLGYENVRVYDGSTTEWNVRGGPTEPGGGS